MGLHDLARRWADADAAMSDAAAALPVAGPGAHAFGADGPGRLGELGGDMFRLWLTAIEARTREAAVHATRLSHVADAVARSGVAYAEVDDAAARPGDGRAPTDDAPGDRHRG